MRIIGSDISLQSQRSFVSAKRESTNLRVVNGNQELTASSTRDSFRTEGSATFDRAVFEDRADFRPPPAQGRGNGNPVARGRQDLAGLLDGAGVGTVEIPVIDGEDAESLNPNLKLTKMLMEKLLGRKVNISVIKFEAGEAVSVPGGEGPAGGPPAQGGGAQPGGFGLSYNRRVTTYESENTQFSAQGSVKTADGKTIDFNLALNMSREYLSHEETSIRMGTLKDPLVVNFDGGAAELSDAKFTFDLDADGTQEQLHFLKPGSAFLAYDKNENGTIDDGSELFGAQSGDGFGDLAAYDTDGNRFIDEGDAIYSKLSLYNKTAQGDTLVSLKDAGIGAIYLGSADTEFSLNNLDDNSTQGKVRQTGVYLGENGEVGTVQQVDLAVEEVPEEPVAAAEQAASADAPAAASEPAHIDLEG